MSLSIYNLSEIAKSATLNLKKQKNLRLRELNPDLHLRKLLESHRFENVDLDCYQFFISVSHNNDWCSGENMPTKWSYKTWSEAIRSLIYLFEIPQVKDHLIQKTDSDQYKNTMILYDNMRKKWMAQYRKSPKNEPVKVDDFSSNDSSHYSSDTGTDIIPTTSFSFIDLAITHLDRVIKSRPDDLLLGATLNNILDLLHQTRNS